MTIVVAGFLFQDFLAGDRLIMNLNPWAIFGPVSATGIGRPAFGFAPCIEPFITAFGEIDGLDVLHANVDETPLHFTVSVKANRFAGFHLFPALLATTSRDAGYRRSFVGNNPLQRAFPIPACSANATIFVIQYR